MLNSEGNRIYTNAFDPNMNKLISFIESYNSDLTNLPLYYKNIQKDVFSYGYCLSSEKYPMLWYLNYYNCCKFIYAVDVSEGNKEQVGRVP